MFTLFCLGSSRIGNRVAASCADAKGLAEHHKSSTSETNMLELSSNTRIYEPVS
jgi:hypothetical protein